MDKELEKLLNQFNSALGEADTLKCKIFELLEDKTGISKYDIYTYIEDDLNYVFGIDEEKLEELLKGDN